MTKKKKIRIKFTMSISIMILSSIFLIYKIIPPDIWLKLIMFIMGSITVGFSVKTISNR